MSLDFTTLNAGTLLTLSIGGVLAGVVISMVAIMLNKWLDWLYNG